MGRFIDRTGQRHGRLVFLRPTEQNPQRWVLACDCGQEVEAWSKNVVEGGTRSCGCLNLEALRARRKHPIKEKRPKRKDWTGLKFNRLTLIAPNPDNYSKWAAKCDCGAELEVFTANVSRGLTKSCGCLNLEMLAERNAVRTANALTPEQVAARDAAWRERNRDRLIEQKRAYNKANKERLSEGKRACYVKRRDHYIARVKANYAADPEAAIRRERHKATLKKEATPAWAEIDTIKALYREARRLTEETGVRHHVDHIVPLRHDLVCGLHVQNNLRVITAADNWKKHNRLDLGDQQW